MSLPRNLSFIQARSEEIRRDKDGDAALALLAEIPRLVDQTIKYYQALLHFGNQQWAKDRMEELCDTFGSEVPITMRQPKKKKT